MNGFFSLGGACLCLALSGCVTVSKDWVATGGSRADGVVRLSYDHSEFEEVTLSEPQGVQVALERCKVWGYTGATPFGGSIRRCNAVGGLLGCRQWFVSRDYQCLGDGTPVPQK